MFRRLYDGVERRDDESLFVWRARATVGLIAFLFALLCWFAVSVAFIGDERWVIGLSFLISAIALSAGLFTGIGINEQDRPAVVIITATATAAALAVAATFRSGEVIAVLVAALSVLVPIFGERERRHRSRGEGQATTPG